ncbi:hypothetical protein M9M90_09665 [Phenylobacterium sp. LH3H17]|uniref:hypothetical protein n=1 Tax=Phenylobacterium sp. LH3H17 TaxID=2903901 RepID=UPI0020C96B74|nr:hypothetical protein [Phenylobacterium sp. LH3H17]UTP41419.1 hypothetical protein M9M90_09665 [Phenylobacterium sp. LH3H17]
MNKMLAAGLAGLAMSFGALAAAPVLAQDAAAAPAPASVDATPVMQLVDNPATKAVVDKHIPQLASHPAYDQFKEMTLKQLQPLSQGAITDEMLVALQADLDKVK